MKTQGIDSLGRPYNVNPVTGKRLNQHLIPLYIRVLDALHAKPATAKELKKQLNEKGKRVSNTLQRLQNKNKITRINNKWALTVLS